MMEAVSTSETSDRFHQITRRSIPEYNHLQPMQLAQRYHTSYEKHPVSYPMGTEGKANWASSWLLIYKYCQHQKCVKLCFNFPSYVL
jgi:hypothetical protein